MYNKVLSNIIKIAECAKNGDLDGIEKIDISNMFKWKIAFLYSEYKFLNFYAEDGLRYLAKKYGMENSEKLTFADMYKFLLSKKQNNENIFVYASNLWNEWLVYKDEESKKRKYWSGGVYWDEEKKLEEFSQNNYWKIGWEKESNKKGSRQAWNNIKEIQNGDFIAFHGYGGQNDLTIYQISKVIDKDIDKGILYIEKINTDRDILFHGKAPNLNKGGWFGTLFQITGEEAVEKIFGNYIGDSTMTNENEQEKLIKKYTDLLKNTKNLILTGAPGTGKTYLAKQIAEAMGCSENEIGFVQFHPSYDYTDFVEGLRPVQDEASGQIGFERKDGVFKKFCEKALKNLFKNFVFIIDEINRGEVSKIFGELFYSVDPGYRVTTNDLEKAKSGKTITTIRTQYANMEKTQNDFDRAICSSTFGHFFIPENVYIIGTMNDIDRSVESMDFAFRRRFTWAEIKASDTQYMLDERVDENGETQGLPTDLAKEAKNRMDNLNKAISDTENFGSAYEIGASYFLKLNQYEGSSEEKFKNLWEYHIKGILEEYLRGNPQKVDLMEKFEKAFGIVE